MVSKEDIDEAVASRDIADLANFIRFAESPEVRAHLAQTIWGLLSGKIRFPRRRPKSVCSFEQELVADEIWDIKTSKGWGKISSAVEHVAKEKGWSPRTVWKCWARFDRQAYEERKYSAEAGLYDYVYEEAMAASRAAAIEYLTDTEGAGREFSDEEISDAEDTLYAKVYEAFDEY